LRTWDIQGRGNNHLATKKLLDDMRHPSRLQQLLQEEDLVQKELTKRELLDRQQPSFLHHIEARDYINGNVELGLKRREAIHYRGFRVGILDGRERCSRRRWENCGGWPRGLRCILGGGGGAEGGWNQHGPATKGKEGVRARGRVVGDQRQGRRLARRH
jgi:hypothetical protein